MTDRVIVFDRIGGRLAAALVKDGRMDDLIADPANPEQSAETGDIAMVRLTRKAGQHGAFCDTPFPSGGFLREARGLREGDRFLAQVLSLPEDGKAATLATKLLFKGPRLIVTVGAPGVNVSRKIGNQAEAQRLKDVVTQHLATHSPGDDTGVIIRSEARNADEKALAAELALHAAALARCQAADPDRIDTLVKTDALGFALREWLLPLPAEIVGPADVLQRIAGGPAAAPLLAAPDLADLRLRAEDAPFDLLGLADQIAALASPQVPMGQFSCIIEPTSALVAVDVNTGADFSPAAGLKANLAVARDLPRQLRLRGLGGKIVIDFAPMPKQNRKTLEEALAKSLRSDPIETSAIGWTQSGLYELQRKRERRPFRPG